MRPNELPEIMQNLCEIREAQPGTKIPQNAKAVGKPSGRTYEEGHRLSKKEAGESLFVYRPQCRLDMDELQITSWVTDQWPDGAVAWCDVELRIDDPVALLSELSNESGGAGARTEVTVAAVEEWMRPRIVELLDRLGDRGRLTSEAYWPEVAGKVAKELRPPGGLVLSQFALRKVRTLEQSVKEGELKEDYRARIQQAIDDGTLKRLASQGRINDFVNDLEAGRAISLLTAEERRQEAVDRLCTYVEILGLHRERFDEQMVALHHESFSIHRQLADTQARMLDLFERVTPPPSPSFQPTFTEETPAKAGVQQPMSRVGKRRS